MHPHPALAIPFQADPLKKPPKTGSSALLTAVLARFPGAPGDLIALPSRLRPHTPEGCAPFAGSEQSFAVADVWQCELLS
jgi:hypothetical protein